MDKEKDTIILQQLARFCAYRERCSYEVKQKLIELGHDGDSEKILDFLIKEGYLNDTRHAHHFASGKLRINGWGKIKIAAALSEKKVKRELIKDALDALNHSEYIEIARNLAQKKMKEKANSGKDEAKNATIRFLLSRGFEYDTAKKVTEK